MEADDEDAEIDAEDVVEVIDLDELDDEERREIADEDDDGNDGAVGFSSSHITPVREDNSERDLEDHGGKSVFCCALHPNATHVATGGEDDRLVVRDAAKNFEIDFESGGDAFKDSVVQAAFSSKDGAFLAAADMSGVIKVWKVAAKEVVWEFETSDITSMFWHPSSNILFATTVDSELWMWKIPSGESKIYAGHGERAECADLLPDGRRAVVGYADGSLRIFDLKTGDVERSVSDASSAHADAVSCISARSDGGAILATGGVDGLAKVLNVNTGKNIAAFDCRGSKEREQAEDSAEDSTSTVEALLFSPAEQNLLITGSLEGLISVWDLSSQVSRASVRVGSGITRLSWLGDGRRDIVLAATLDGLVRLVDVRRGKVVADCSGHSAAVLDMAVAKDGSHLLTASDDGHTKVFNLTKITSDANAAAST